VWGNERGDMKTMKIAMYAALVVVVALVAMRTVRAQSGGGTVAAITKLENDTVKADLAGDQTWAQKYLAEDWMDCDSDGKWYTKADVLKMMADSANNKFNTEAISDIKVRVYGATAVANYTDTYDAVIAGEHRTRTILATDVWVRIGGEWKQVNSQATKAQ
jgi:hypothetical protein